MKLKEIYEIAIETGIEADPRGKSAVEAILKKNKDEFEKMSDEDKVFFDKDSLQNPYGDTRILWGDPETEIEAIMTGIDLESTEVLLADRLNEKQDAKINLLIAHHPEGRSLAQLNQVMGMQADVWNNFGVPINIGDVIIGKRAAEIQRALMPINHQRPVDAARLLGMNFMNVHTPADNQVSKFVQKHLDKAKIETVSDVIKELKKIDEYAQSAKMGVPPTALVGSPSTRAGKVLVGMTGGTEGPEESIEKLAQAGVGTLVEMHLSDKLRKKAEEHHLNVVIAGHIASDNIGMNLFLDKLEAKGLTNIVTASGMFRVKR